MITTIGLDHPFIANRNLIIQLSETGRDADSWKQGCNATWQVRPKMRQMRQESKGEAMKGGKEKGKKNESDRKEEKERKNRKEHTKLRVRRQNDMNH